MQDNKRNHIYTIHIYESHKKHLQHTWELTIVIKKNRSESK
jgi:hypothetical protein